MKTLLDNDLYKYTMMYAVWRQYPQKAVKYGFINRRPEDRFNEEAFTAIQDRVQAMGDIRLADDEIEFLRQLELFDEDFLTYLATFQLKPEQVRLQLIEGELQVHVEGLWLETILWEVPLLAIISECYFEFVDTDWNQDLEDYFTRTVVKGRRLTRAGVKFIEFGTRRRRSYATQETVVKAFNVQQIECAGTSNVHFAMKYGMKPVGTMAHEWIMAHAGMHDIETANARALVAWRQVYGDQLAIALTDTYTTELFLKNVEGELARQFKGFRHDSECPIAFAGKVLAFYETQGIDPLDKLIVFSDSLNTDKVLEIEAHVAGRIPTAYGVGTHFTNDFAESRALNIVIKLQNVDGVDVAKISDNLEKASGPPEAVKQALQAIRELGMEKVIA